MYAEGTYDLPYDLPLRSTINSTWDKINIITGDTNIDYLKSWFEQFSTRMYGTHAPLVKTIFTYPPIGF